jgi:hypothetical protein
MKVDTTTTTASDNTGFSRLKPYNTRYWKGWNVEKAEYHQKNNIKKCKTISTYSKITAQYLQFARSFEPYYFFITLTFGQFTGFDKRCQFTNNLLFMLNRKKFTDKFKARNHFLEGFAFFEDHPSRNFESDDDKLHIHLLIKHDKKFDEKSFSQHVNEFYTIARKIKDSNDRPVFNEKYIDIRAPGEERAGYCMADINDRNISRVKMLCVDGLSDNLLYD